MSFCIVRFWTFVRKVQLVPRKPCELLFRRVSQGIQEEGVLKRKQVKLGVLLKPVIPALSKLWQEDCFMFEASLGNLILLYYEF